MHLKQRSCSIEQTAALPNNHLTAAAATARIATAIRLESPTDPNERVASLFVFSRIHRCRWPSPNLMLTGEDQVEEGSSSFINSHQFLRNDSDSPMLSDQQPAFLFAQVGVEVNGRRCSASACVHPERRAHIYCPKEASLRFCGL